MSAIIQLIIHNTVGRTDARVVSIINKNGNQKRVRYQLPIRLQNMQKQIAARDFPLSGLSFFILSFMYELFFCKKFVSRQFL